MLTGEKVVVRALEKPDMDRLHEFANDYELYLMADDEEFVPKSREQVEKMFADLDKNPEEVGPFGIEADGKLIGTCGLHHFDKHSRVCAFGITIFDRDYLGKGYGRDAVRVLIEYAFVHRNMHKLWLTVYADNTRAIRSYKALGFVEEGLQKQQVWNQGRYKDWLYMGLLRSDWQP